MDGSIEGREIKIERTAPRPEDSSGSNAAPCCAAIGGTCEVIGCDEPSTCYDVMDNKLCDDHWEQVRQEELADG